MVRRPQERSWQKSQGKPVGETHLFFGCRNEAVDFIYREELEAFAADGLLTLHTAFSRDQVTSGAASIRLIRVIFLAHTSLLILAQRFKLHNLQEQKVYVTNRLKEQAEAVWRCIGENNGHFYVCGDAGKMAKGG